MDDERILPSIGALLREVLEATPEAGTEGVADAVIAGIDPVDYPRYLRELLVQRISAEVSYLRQKVTPVAVREGVRRGVSMKQQLIRDEYWPSFLQQRIAVPGGFKFLADATADDLRFVAVSRREQAADLLVVAEQFERLASMMERARVSRLADIGPEQGREILGRAA